MENGGLFLLFGAERFGKLLTGLFTRCLLGWGVVYHPADNSSCSNATTAFLRHVR